MSKHARMHSRNYVLALEEWDDAYTMGRSWGIKVIPNVGMPKKATRGQTQIDQPL